jgi:hypothetical protein
MATIADYKIVLDSSASLVRGGTNFVRQTFTLPSNIVPEQHGILMYRVEAEDPDDLRYTLSLNDHEVVTFTHDTDRFGTVHEVIDPNVLHNGENRFAAVATAGSGTIKISDVVVHFQVTI